MAEDRVVEVGAAEVFDAGRRADDRQRTGCGLAQQDGVEGAAAEVVDGERRPGRQRIGRLVVARCGDRLGDDLDLADAGAHEGGADEVGAVCAPGDRDGHDDRRRQAPEALRRHRRHPVDEEGEQVFGREGAPADVDRNLVAHAALDLADETFRLHESSAFCGIAEEHVPGGDVDRTRCRISMPPQRQDVYLRFPLIFCCVRYSGCGAACARIDSQYVGPRHCRPP